MTVQAAVILIANDTSRANAPRPMLLRRVMGTPLLSWLAASLKDLGVCRCLLVCSDVLAEEAAACFPPQITTCCAAPGSDAIRGFLSAEDGNALLITGPAVCVPGTAILTDEDRTDAPTGVCLAPCADLLAELDRGSDLASLAECCGSICTEQDGFFAVSSQDELADWQPILKRMLLYELAKQGVEIWDYDNCYIAPSVQIGAGTEILPGVILRGRTVIGKNCTIGPNSLLEHAEIGDGVKVNASQIYESSVGAKTTVGPFAYIRPNCRIGSDVRIGDFVEIKNSVIDNGTKVSHLTYIGDSDVGKRINFGCGTVTVNYDRAKKHRTTIEDDAFIGCNTNLVAPVTVGEGAYIAAGSTITNDVPANALGIARARQSNKHEWATSHKLKEKKQER